tara:strand:- start:2777 stop:3688 length:912 start_codon:yes stop_codon:yes gene_type:complete
MPPFNLKGLLQDEEFLFAAGLLQQGSQGKGIGEATLPSLLNAGKIKKAFAPTAQKTKKAFDNVLMKDVFVTDMEIKNMPNRFTPIDSSQRIEVGADGQVTISSGKQKPDNFKRKNELKANDIKNTFSIISQTIPTMKKKISETEIGAVGGSIALFETMSSQFTQAAEALGVKDKLEMKDTSKIDAFLERNGISKKAANYAQLKSSVINLSYTLAKIAEPGNPKFSEGDILRQMKRIGVGGSREQFIASLDQVYKDEFLRASTSFKTLYPDGDFGFTLDGNGTLQKIKNKNIDEEDDNDPFKIR